MFDSFLVACSKLGKVAKVMHFGQNGAILLLQRGRLGANFGAEEQWLLQNFINFAESEVLPGMSRWTSMGRRRIYVVKKTENGTELSKDNGREREAELGASRTDRL